MLILKDVAISAWKTWYKFQVFLQTWKRSISPSTNLYWGIFLPFCQLWKLRVHILQMPNFIPKFSFAPLTSKLNPPMVASVTISPKIFVMGSACELEHFLLFYARVSDNIEVRLMFLCFSRRGLLGLRSKKPYWNRVKGGLGYCKFPTWCPRFQF